jgi:hypothetical protein
LEQEKFLKSFIFKKPYFDEGEGNAVALHYMKGYEEVEEFILKLLILQMSGELHAAAALP